MPSIITKISGGNGWNAGGYGVSRWNTGEIHSLEFRVNELVNAKYLGVGFDNAGEGFGDADFFWELNGGNATVYENFSIKAGPFNVGIGQRLIITIDASDIVRYYIDSELKYTSSVTPTFPLGIDFSIFHTGEKIIGVIEDDENAIFETGASKVNVDFTYDSSFLMDMLIYEPDFDFNDFDFRDFTTANPDFIEFLADMILKELTTISIGLDMKLGDGYETINSLIDMVLKASPMVTFPIDVRLVAHRLKTFNMDMTLRKPFTFSTDIDMRLIRILSVNSLMDMVVKQSGIEKEMIVDMILKKFDNELQFNQDMVLKATYTKAILLDMLIKSILTTTFNVDMNLTNRFTNNMNVDMTLKASFIKTFGLDMRLTGLPFTEGREDTGYIRTEHEDTGYIRIKSEDIGYIRIEREDSGVIV